MFNRHRILATVFLFIILAGFMGQTYAGSNYTYSIGGSNNNEIIVASNLYGKNMRIQIQKGNEKLNYSLNNPEERLPIQLGDGTYTVKILEHVSGKSYKVLDKSDLTVNGSNSQDVYLSSGQPVYWKGINSVTTLADSLTINLNTDAEKVTAIYNYIVNNITYDDNKINNLTTDYIPQLDETLRSQSGICYDYAALFAGMLRYQGIPTKLVKGYKNDMSEYHAWNEVLVDGSWMVVDTTYDAALKNQKNKPSMFKGSNEYNKQKEF